KTAAEVIKANPADPNGYNVQGTVQLAMGNLDAAAASYKTALDKDPTFSAAALNLARIEERRANSDAARQWYQKALAADGNNVVALEGLAQLARASDD